jgi:hypothetical protein
VIQTSISPIQLETFFLVIVIANSVSLIEASGSFFLKKKERGSLSFDMPSRRGKVRSQYLHY